MIEAGNIEGAIMMLGGQRTDNIVELIKKRKLEELEEIESKIRIYISRQNQEQIETWKNKRKRVKIQLTEIEQRFNQILSRDCTICFSNLTNPVLEPLCQNVFCGECLFKWLEEKGTCPLCRCKVDASKLVYINTEEPTEATMEIDIPDRPQTKIETLVSIFEKNPAGKFLLFSAYDNSFAPLQIVMLEHNISYTEIKGTALNKKRCIQNFKDGNTQVVFINSKTNVAGINLQEATDIILYHDMDVETEKQIIGRVDRIGRTHELSIHYLHIFQ
jgi:SNF2 family DNA or RNA helicase